MHIHYFQHDHYENLGYIGEWAESGGYTVSVTRFDLEPVMPELESIDWLVIMGGKMSVNEEAKHPWLADEKNYIRKAIRAGKVVLGICLGSQLIASALGAVVYQNSEPEIGFFPVTFSEAAASDPVFQYFPKELRVLHLHEDTFVIPKGAIGMASSAITQNQAFRFGQRVFAFQFHFEVTADSLPVLIKADNNQLAPGKWIQSAPEINGFAPDCIGNNAIFREILDAIALQNPSNFQG